MLVIAEAAPLEAFGEAASRRVAHLLEAAGIELFTETIPASFDGASLFVPMAGTLRCDAAVALPALIGHPIAGVPHDASGFVPVDAHCRVEGVDGVYAVGDMTARPLKQGGLAAQQADVAASAIAAAAGVPIALEPYRPVLHAMLLTGEGHQYLHYPPAERTGLDGPRVTPAWLPHKIAAAHLGPYLATHGELIVQEPGRV
jgi:sulfide:quinone oxidoreductase